MLPPGTWSVNRTTAPPSGAPAPEPDPAPAADALDHPLPALLEALDGGTVLGPLRIEDGQMFPPAKPGLGLEIPEDVIRKFRVA